MRDIRTRVSISQADYKELQSDNSRWTLKEYCYWAAKFKSCYPAEGYGMYSVRLETEDGKYYISWEHYDSCD